MSLQDVKDQQLNNEFTGLHDFPVSYFQVGSWSTYSCEYSASVRKSSLILFCWFMDGFFLFLPLLFLLWTTAGTILTAFAYFLVFCCLFSMAGKRNLHKVYITWWKRETFYSGLLLKPIAREIQPTDLFELIK